MHSLLMCILLTTSLYIHSKWSSLSENISQNSRLYLLKNLWLCIFPLLRPYKSHKLQLKSQECVVVDERIYISKNVMFSESKFPCSNLFSSQPYAFTELHPPLIVFLTIISLNIPTSLLPLLLIFNTIPLISINIWTYPLTSFNTWTCYSLPRSYSLTSKFITTHFVESLPHIDPRQPSLCRPENIHSMWTGAKSGITNPILNLTLLLTHAKSKSIKTAISSPTWYATMKSKYDALIRNNM